VNLKSFFRKFAQKFAQLRGKSVTYECEWCVGHGGYMVPDPELVNHVELRNHVRGKITRVTVEIIGTKFNPEGQPQ